MRKLDGDTKKIIELYKSDKEKEIKNLVIQRKEEIRNEVNKYVEEQEKLYLDYNTAMKNIREKYRNVVRINYKFEVSNYASEYTTLYYEDEILRKYEKELNEIINERNNITLALQFADSKSKEYKEALKKLERGY